MKKWSCDFKYVFNIQPKDLNGVGWILKKTKKNLSLVAGIHICDLKNKKSRIWINLGNEVFGSENQKTIIKKIIGVLNHEYLHKAIIENSDIAKQKNITISHLPIFLKQQELLVSSLMR